LPSSNLPAPPKETTVPSATRLRDTVEEFLAARNEHKADWALRLLADDVEWRVPSSVGAPLRGARARAALSGGLARELFVPGTEHFHVKRIFSREERAVVEHTLTFTTRSGAVYAAQCCAVFDVLEHRITRVTSYTDTRAAELALGEGAMEQALAAAHAQ
jgi:ketosteroid isomerase-like protein